MTKGNAIKLEGSARVRHWSCEAMELPFCKLCAWFHIHPDNAEHRLCRWKGEGFWQPPEGWPTPTSCRGYTFRTVSKMAELYPDELHGPDCIDRGGNGDQLAEGKAAS